MLRKTVLVLALANGAAWLWYQGGLSELGLGQAPAREPERLERQIHPEWMHLGPLAEQARTPTASAPSAPEAPPLAPAPEVAEQIEPAVDENPPAAPDHWPPSEVAAPLAAAADPIDQHCLQAGPFNAVQASALRAALADWPEDSWRFDSTVTAARWMVLLRVSDTESMNQRRTELRSRNVDVDLPAAAFRPGLSLGRFSSEEAARQELANLGRKGVRGLQVVVERPEVSAHNLVLPRADRALREQASRLGPSLLAGNTWQNCD